MQLSFYVPAMNQNMRWATYSVRGRQVQCSSYKCSHPLAISQFPIFAQSVMGLVPASTKKRSKVRGIRAVMTQCGSTCLESTLGNHFTCWLAEEINSIATRKPWLTGVNAMLTSQED